MYRFWNDTKTFLLMAALMGLCLAVGYLLGGQSAMIGALAVGAMINIVALFFSDKIALATMHAQPVSRQDDPALWNMVENLSQRAGLPMPGVYVSPAHAPNAFATGRSPLHSVVCVTQGLRQMLSDRELEGVIAHELSHIQHRDMLIGTVAAIIAGAITWLAHIAMFFGGRDDRDRNPIVALLLLILAPLAAAMIQMAVSRSREYEADREGAELSGSPRGLASALGKLASANQHMPLPVNEAQRHLFIVAPLAGGGVTKLFMTHPPIEERIQRLMEMDRQMPLR